MRGKDSIAHSHVERISVVLCGAHPSFTVVPVRDEIHKIVIHSVIILQRFEQCICVYRNKNIDVKDLTSLKLNCNTYAELEFPAVCDSDGVAAGSCQGIIRSKVEYESKTQSLLYVAVWSIHLD